MTSVIIYTSKLCAPCGSLKKYLDHKGVEYTLRDIEMPRWAHIVQELTGKLTVPVTIVGNSVVTGLDYRGLNKALAEL